MDMAIFIALSALFFVGGFLGWVLELLFRRFVSAKKWVNPGFLTGPMLPLYGFGVVGFYILANRIRWQTLTNYSWANYLIEIVAIGVMLTAIEYIAGLIFIKGLKVKLWDYSTQPGNVQGIICPLFSLIWTLCGTIYIFWLNPFFINLFDFVEGEERIFSFIIGFFYGVLAIDLGWSVGLVSRIRRAVADSRFVVSWDRIKASFAEHYHRTRERSHWLFAFSTRREDWNDMFNEYLASARAEATLRNEEKIQRRQKRLERLKERLRHQDKK